MLLCFLDDTIYSVGLKNHDPKQNVWKYYKIRVRLSYINKKKTVAASAVSMK